MTARESNMSAREITAELDDLVVIRLRGFSGWVSRIAGWRTLDADAPLTDDWRDALQVSRFEANYKIRRSGHGCFLIVSVSELEGDRK